MNDQEKVEVALCQDYQFVGNLNSLCYLLREEILKLKAIEEKLLQSLQNNKGYKYDYRIYNIVEKL